jgi:hypothetical protein
MLYCFDIVSGGFNRLFVRQQEISPITRGYFNYFPQFA